MEYTTTRMATDSSTTDLAINPAIRLDRPRTSGTDAAGLRNMQQLIQLRWFAILGQILTIVIVRFGLGVALPLQGMALALSFLLLFNLASLQSLRGGRAVSERALFVSLLVDMATLTAQLYLSGGATNPFVSLYLLQIIHGAV